MKDILSKIIFYRSLAEDPVLKCLAEADAPGADAAEARSGINSCIHSILETATTYGFTEDLWAAYLTFLLVMDENPYALVNEHRTNPEGSADILVESDCACLIRLMHYDFSNLAAVCGEDRFTLLRNYTALSKPDRMYFSFISRTINELARDLRTETDPAAFRRRLVEFYRILQVEPYSLESWTSSKLQNLANLATFAFDIQVLFVLKFRNNKPMLQ